MIAVDTANTEQEGHHHHQQHRSMMDNAERISSSTTGVETPSEYLVPLKDSGTTTGQENKVNGLHKAATAATNATCGDSGSVSSGTMFDILKPHDLPPIVETRAGGTHDVDFETNSQSAMLSPSFDNDHENTGETYDSFPTTTSNENRFSLPSVNDVIRMFGGSAKVRTNYRSKMSEEELSPTKNHFSRSSISSTGSAASRRTDVPMAKRHGRDDDSSLGDYSFSSMPAFAEPTRHSPEWNRTRSELDLLREQSIVSSRRRLQARSAARKDRLRYKLKDGRRGMTEKDLNLSRTFLPADKMIALQQEQETAHTATKNKTTNSEIYVWLMSPSHKIFEVVRVPYNGNDTTIGEVLVSARGAALDPVLAEQRYVSLCNDKMELVAPMLPVNFLFQKRLSQTGSSSVTQSLMAVPEGWTAFVIREIQKGLTGNRRVKKWLKQKDIFRPLSEEEKADRRERRRRHDKRSKD